MATYTSNYGLHQWEPSDNFLRTDFNTDLQKIDTALGDQDTSLQDLLNQVNQRVQIMYGSYVGRGGNGRVTVTLGIQPQAVIIAVENFMLLATQARPNAAVKLTSTGFYTDTEGDSIQANTYNSVYHYMVLFK